MSRPCALKATTKPLILCVFMAGIAGCASSVTRPPAGSTHVMNLPDFDVKACFPNIDRNWGEDARLEAMQVAVMDIRPRVDECFNDHFFRKGPYSGELSFQLMVQPDRAVKVGYTTNLRDPELNACISAATALIELPKSSERAGQTYDATLTINERGDRSLRIDGSPAGTLVGSIRTRTLDACHCLEPYIDTEPPNVAFRFRMKPDSPYPQEIALASQVEDRELVSCLGAHLARIPVTTYDRELGAAYRFRFSNSRAMSVEKLLADADEAANREDYDRAMALYDQVLRAEPRNERARFGRSSVYLQTDRPGQALEILQELRREHPGRATYHYAEARAFRHLDRVDEAYAAVKKALKIEEDFRYHHFISGIYYDREVTRSALRHARQSRALNPAFAQAYVAEARALTQGSEHEAALEALETALTLDFEDPSIFHDIAMVYFELKAFSESLNAIDEGIRRGHGPARVHFNRGVVLQHLDRRAEAGEAFCQAALIDRSMTSAREACEESRR